MVRVTLLRIKTPDQSLAHGLNFFKENTMARSYLTEAISKKKTPQTEPIPGSNQQMNNAGGFSWEVDKWKQLERFCCLGSEGGSYYVGERKLTQDNAKSVEACLQEDGLRTIKIITDISDGGRAPKNDPALFALAIAISKGDTKTKQAAAAALPKVARIGTHLFHFAQFANEMRGWGPVLRSAIGEWYLTKDVNKLAYQLVKYQSRDGWSHRDLLRLSHPKSTNTEQNIAFKWAVGKKDWDECCIPMIDAFESAKEANEKQTVNLIREYNLPRECVKTEFLKSPKIWEALLEKMPLTAMIRNLGNMSAIGLLTPNSDSAIKVIKSLSDKTLLKKNRIHPLNVYLARTTYALGHGIKGSNSWTPTQQIADALEEAFYLSFDFVEPTNKRWFLGLDVSGSMTAQMANLPISCRDASALLAMVTMRTEKIYFAAGFSNGSYKSQWSSRGYGSGLTPLSLNPKMSLKTAVETISGLDFGGTDCALPMIYAKENKIPADIFVVYTDSETWAGKIHPSQALKEYRQAMGIPAKLIVVGMTSNNFTIADPNDSGMLDVVGFSTDVPSVMADFATDGQSSSESELE